MPRTTSPYQYASAQEFTNASVPSDASDELIARQLDAVEDVDDEVEVLNETNDEDDPPYSQGSSISTDSSECSSDFSQRTISITSRHISSSSSRSFSDFSDGSESESTEPEEVLDKNGLTADDRAIAKKGRAALKKKKTKGYVTPGGKEVRGTPGQYGRAHARDAGPSGSDNHDSEELGSDAGTIDWDNLNEPVGAANMLARPGPRGDDGEDTSTDLEDIPAAPRAIPATPRASPATPRAGVPLFLPTPSPSPAPVRALALDHGPEDNADEKDDTDGEDDPDGGGFMPMCYLQEFDTASEKIPPTEDVADTTLTPRNSPRRSRTTNKRGSTSSSETTPTARARHDRDLTPPGGSRASDARRLNKGSKGGANVDSREGSSSERGSRATTKTPGRAAGVVAKNTAQAKGRDIGSKVVDAGRAAGVVAKNTAKAKEMDTRSKVADAGGNGKGKGKGKSVEMPRDVDNTRGRTKRARDPDSKESAEDQRPVKKLRVDHNRGSSAGSGQASKPDGPRPQAANPLRDKHRIAGSSTKPSTFKTPISTSSAPSAQAPAASAARSAMSSSDVRSASRPLAGGGRAPSRRTQATPLTAARASDVPPHTSKDHPWGWENEPSKEYVNVVKVIRMMPAKNPKPKAALPASGHGSNKGATIRQVEVPAVPVPAVPKALKPVGRSSSSSSIH